MMCMRRALLCCAVQCCAAHKIKSFVSRARINEGDGGCHVHARTSGAGTQRAWKTDVGTRALGADQRPISPPSSLFVMSRDSAAKMKRFILSCGRIRTVVYKLQRPESQAALITLHVQTARGGPPPIPTTKLARQLGPSAWTRK